ncbi:Putative ribonuclease H-like superfamily [Septoria linicola]|uniref:Ribonuclease H-like superfamily n=1 Tax=Septoria linicola TaxID=215465 RepID=A0A9Q9EHL4_9PEZI|nr:putative ribonuclease H-like superfamily [Septoria linicola]USW51105.1 Putative ribonuclease H-like superfamily [Septoria linicola]
MANNNSAAAKAVFVRWEPRVDGESSPAVSHDLNPTGNRSPTNPARGAGVAVQVEPRWDLLLPGEMCACDIEFQDHQVAGDVHPSGHKKAGRTRWSLRLGWISIVNTRGEIVLDVHVHYPTDPNIQVKMPYAAGKDFGVTFDRLKPENGAVSADIVEAWCEKIFANRTVVLHSGGNDRRAFMYRDVFAAANIYDTQDDWACTKAGDNQPKPGLAALAKNLLGEIIQADGNHGPFEDALTTMKIYLLKHSYDREAEAAKWQAVYELE